MTTASAIRLGDTLLEHHEGHNEEILSIVAHELGHAKLHHIAKMMVFNCFYMLVFGALMIPVIDHKEFLASFNIYMESYFMTLVIFILFYQRSFDVPIRLLIKWIERKHEYEADAYAVKVGYGQHLNTGLIRNFS